MRQDYQERGVLRISVPKDSLYHHTWGAARSDEDGL